MAARTALDAFSDGGGYAAEGRGESSVNMVAPIALLGTWEGLVVTPHDAESQKNRAGRRTTEATVAVAVVCAATEAAVDLLREGRWEGPAGAEV